MFHLRIRTVNHGLRSGRFQRASAAKEYLKEERVATWRRRLRLAALLGVAQLALPFEAVQLSVDPSDNKPIGQRTALILVHGWRSGPDKWERLSDHLRERPELLKLYKPYRLQYNWKLHISDNGRELDSLLTKSRFDKVAFIGHSMGGLVIRSCLQGRQGQTASTTYKVDRIITLATPHHGSPLANPAWLQNYSDYSSLDMVIKLLSKFGLDTDGGYCLGWDNYDGLMPRAVWGGDKSRKVPPANRFTSELNGSFDPRLADRMFAYGSYFEVVDSSAVQLIDFDGEGIDWDEKAMKFVAVVLARRLQDDSLRPIAAYCANDGVVPLNSALFLAAGDFEGDRPIADLDGKRVRLDEAEIYELARCRIRIFRNLNHLEMASHEDVFAAIEEDLLRPVDLSDAAPILVIDRSGSIQEVAGLMEEVERRAANIVDAIMKSVREACVINFSGAGQAVVDAPFTSDPYRLSLAIESPSVGAAGTAVFDAVRLAVDEAGIRKGRAMIILLSDGMSNQGSSMWQAVQYCQRKGVPVIAIGFVGTDGRNEEELTRFAEATGGFYVRSETTSISVILERFKKYLAAKAQAKPDPPGQASRLQSGVEP